ncbi:hypothetical protein BU23DRAFT_639655 [Bimuria novae-zelandiae CBS 107.79]|uniref:DUF7730 domain-containing protein n=1 Tax=Bimuria novae-zelandiae CBS 107.79 TaxID=1447943 RepID=A0A6A5VBN5_9PLEO|nr:hypothetical protein BU23DRAFT_639655 [Bimuria novae-zelandiae CBS 107.79]
MQADSTARPALRRPPLITIPNVRSHPMDPNRPSFLNQLPKGIRNHIYALIFEHNEMVLISDVQEYRRDKKRYPTAANPDSEFVYGFGQSLGLLRTCRQIYHEGIGFLYSNNTFMFTRARGFHSLFKNVTYERGGSYDYITGNGKPNLRTGQAAEWLCALGSQMDLVREFHVDVDAVFRHDVRNRPFAIDSFHVLPLARLKWRDPSLALDVKFSALGRSFNLTGEPYIDQAPWYGDKDATVLNNIFESLCTQDQLNLRRYEFSDRLLHWISIDKNLNHGMISFAPYSLGNYATTIEKSFDVLEYGKLLQISPTQTPTNFSNLPYTLKDEEICDASCVGNWLPRGTHYLSNNDVRKTRIVRQLPSPPRLVWPPSIQGLSQPLGDLGARKHVPVRAAV